MLFPSAAVRSVLSVCFLLAFPIAAVAQRASWALPDDAFGNRLWKEYFTTQTERLRQRTLATLSTREAWEAGHAERRRQLQEMLGLDPWPERTDLSPVVTGRTERDGFVVERVQFQSLPGLYVTGNLYLPMEAGEPAPGVLYVCGHAGVKEGDVSLGNKTAYQHHGAWFARNGYACLTIDSLQLGEIEGIHHGTYRYGMWWWNARGYTPAGVEAWNCIRALDYLQQRPEVDGERLGVTGRSGGGAYSWWTAALDDRIRVAAPVAGVADLQNHVVDGCVEGHCDCMFYVNTYQWDYPMLAALVAPRPLLIVNTDSDDIFPLDGVMRVHDFTRKVYRLLDADDQLGLQISEGPHSDGQNLQVAVSRWFDRFLRDADEPVQDVGVNYFEPSELRVFAENPTDEVNTTIQETFVPRSRPATASSRVALEAQADEARDWLRSRSFAAWPEERAPLDWERVYSGEREGMQLSAYEYTTEAPFRLRFYLIRPVGATPGRINVSYAAPEFLDAGFHSLLKAAFPDLPFREEVEVERDALEEWERFAESWPAGPSPDALVVLAPRGVGDASFSVETNRQQHFRRRLNLLGQTLDGMQLYDLLVGLEAVRAAAKEEDWSAPITLKADGARATAAIYAALFDRRVAELDLTNPTPNHRDGPIYLNVLRRYDAPDALAAALPFVERARLSFVEQPGAWAAAQNADQLLGGGRLVLSDGSTDEEGE